MSDRPRIVDSHCHLQHLEPDERERALDTARERGVRGFLVPAVRLDEGASLVAFAERHDDVWCALGVHPHDASSWSSGDERRLADLLAHPKAVAVGECGLDFFYDHAPREVQAEVLRAQWRIAIDLDLPVVVHNRESDEAMLALVREPEFAALRGDFHSFAGAPSMAAELRQRGFSFGFSGMVTFARADNIRALLAETPLDRILVETDTPYLAPVPHRGKPNRPAWVVDVLERVAAERGLTADRAAAETTGNFFRLFDRAAG
ncbi:MAG: TatD family hydrolase [Holophagales bacterium]|nr:MAG: TatD family hydrolase [Holophagales bacterium]